MDAARCSSRRRSDKPRMDRVRAPLGVLLPAFVRALAAPSCRRHTTGVVVCPFLLRSSSFDPPLAEEVVSFFVGVGDLPRRTLRAVVVHLSDLAVVVLA